MFQRIVLGAARADRVLSAPRVANVVTLSAALLMTARCLWFVTAQHPLDHYVWSDMGVYEARATHILSGRLDGWDTFTPPGYPALLALVYSVFGHHRVVVGVLQAMMVGGSLAIVHRLGLRIAGGLAAVLAVILVAAHLPTMYYAGFLLSETPFTFLLLLGLVLVVRGSERDSRATLIAGGVVLGAAAVVRPNLLAAAPLAPIFLWVMSARRGKVAARWAALIAVGALPAVGVACWHNSRIVGQPAGPATNGGLNFYLNFSHVASVHYRQGRRVDWIAPIPNLSRYKREAWVTHPFYEDRYFYAKGLHEIENDPMRLVAALDNLREGAGLGKQIYWPPWNGHEAFVRGLIRAFFCWGILPALIYTAYLVGSRRAFRREHATELAMILALVSVVVTLWLFLGDPRVRVPFDPFLILLGVAGAAMLARRVAARVLPAAAVPGSDVPASAAAP